MPTHKVFVYGSLKKGFRNNYLIGDSKFIGSFLTSKKYEMISFGGFPAVTKDHEDYKVLGELYFVDDSTLEDLDMLESNEYFYEREQIQLDGVDGKVWMYFLMDDQARPSIIGSNVITHNDVVCWE